MQLDQLVDSAIETVADHLGQVGAQRAGRIADDAVDNLYRLVAHRLWQTPTGARVLGALQQQPATLATRRQAGDVLRDEVRADAQFARALDEAARWAGATSPAPAATFGSISSRGTGNITAQAGRDVAIAGRDVKIKKYHIGSIRFGTGGLVGGVALLLSLVGGGTAAIVATSGPSVTIAQAVGTWQHGGSDVANGGVTVHEDPIVLAVAANGDFDFNTALHMNVGGSTPLDQQYHCTGRAQASGDHFTFTVTGGPCGTFTGSLSGGGQTLSLSSFGQDTQPVALNKTS